MAVYFCGSIDTNTGRVITSTQGKSRVEDSVLDFEYILGMAAVGVRVVQVEVDAEGRSSTIRNELKK